MQERHLHNDLAAAIGAYIVAGIAGMATHIAIARHLGRNAFGIYVSALALVYMLRGLTRFGGVSLIVRDGARDRASLHGSVPLLARLTAVAGMTLVGIGALVALALGYGRTGVLVVAILGLSVGADSVSDSYRGALQATGHMRASSYISAATTGLSAVASIAVVAGGGGVVAASFASTAVSVTAIGFSAATAVRLAQLRAGQISDTRVFLRRVRPFAFTSALSMGASTVDGVLVRTMLGTTAAGAYGGPYRIFSAFGWGAHAYAAVLLPRLARLQAASGEDAFRHAVRRAAAAAAGAMVPVALLGSMLAGPVILTAFGSPYRDAIPTMRVLFLALPATYASVVLRQALLAGGRAHAAARIAGGALIVNVIGNLIVIPRTGIVGAAALTIATDALITLLCLSALKASHHDRATERTQRSMS